MKLELNLPTLERLIGGESEIELALRHQIVKAFEKRYLKQIANTEATRLAGKEVLQLVDAAVKEATDVDGIVANVWPVISNRLRRMVNEAVEQHIEVAIRTHLNQRIDQQRYQLLNEVDRKVRESIDRRIKEEVDRRVHEALTAGIQAAVQHVTPPPRAASGQQSRTVVLDNGGQTGG